MSEIMTQDEFCQRFKARMVGSLDIGTSDEIAVSKYADQVSPTYYDTHVAEGETPEECADADMSYWGEE